MERVSPAEEKFERRRRRIGLLAGPVAALAVYFLSASLPPEQRSLAAVLVLVIAFWVTEAIPIPATALLGPALCILLGVGEAARRLSGFRNPVIFVFLGSFLLARAMTVNHLDRRVALGILRSRLIGSSPRAHSLGGRGSGSLAVNVDQQHRLGCHPVSDCGRPQRRA